MIVHMYSIAVRRTMHFVDNASVMNQSRRHSEVFPTQVCNYKDLGWTETQVRHQLCADGHTEWRISQLILVYRQHPSDRHHYRRASAAASPQCISSSSDGDIGHSPCIGVSSRRTQHPKLLSMTIVNTSCDSMNNHCSRGPKCYEQSPDSAQHVFPYSWIGL